jgi:DNA replication protein DnaC
MMAESQSGKLSLDTRVQSAYENFWANCPNFIPDRYCGLTLDDFSAGVGAALELAAKNAHEVIGANGLLLIGPVGTGKTALLWLYYQTYLRERIGLLCKRLKEYDLHEEMRHWYRHNCFVLTHFQYIQQLRNESRDNWEGSDTTTDINPLLIDDLGRGYDDKSGWNLALQDENIDYRWQRRLPTLITTNKEPEELRSWDGWERIVDRIADPSWMITWRLGGESKRKA